MKDESMIDFFLEKGTMRGGISTVSKLKMSKANNKYLEDFDQSKTNNFIMYFDVNNLYGYIMTMDLPTNSYEWVSEIGSDYLNYLKECLSNKEYGYIFEVDLVYQQEVKYKHIELPLAPEHYNEKLSPNLFNKYKYKTRLGNF